MYSKGIKNNRKRRLQVIKKKQRRCIWLEVSHGN